MSAGSRRTQRAPETRVIAWVYLQEGAGQATRQWRGGVVRRPPVDDTGEMSLSERVSRGSRSFGERSVSLGGGARARGIERTAITLLTETEFGR